MKVPGYFYGLAFGLCCAGVSAQQSPAPVDAQPSVGWIMGQVAVNQDRSEAERVSYVYVQHAKVISRKGKNVMCEEITDHRVTPSSSGSHKELLKLDGRVLTNHKYTTYTSLLAVDGKGKSKAGDHKDSAAAEPGDETIDRDMVENMRSDLLDSTSKDSINPDLLPLTSKEQATYQFQLVGRERLNSRDVFHITFRPKNNDEVGWKGDAYIDTAAFQPVMVTTDMSRKVPLAIRTLMGTNVPGLGFSVIYAPQPDGVWFPVSFGTEFKLDVLFFFHREIIIDAQNREFAKTHVNSSIVSQTGADQR